MEAKFKVNETSRQPDKARIKNAIDITFLKNRNLSIDDLIKALQKDAIHADLRKNEQGLLYGITYVDHKTKCVFNGSDLGKQYTAKGIHDRCGSPDQLKQHEAEHQQARKQLEHIYTNKGQTSVKDLLTTTGLRNVAEDLLEPTEGNNYLPHQLKKPKKKKRKYNSNNL